MCVSVFVCVTQYLSAECACCLSRFVASCLFCGIIQNIIRLAALFVHSKMVEEKENIACANAEPVSKKGAKKQAKAAKVRGSMRCWRGTNTWELITDNRKMYIFLFIESWAESRECRSACCRRCSRRQCSRSCCLPLRSLRDDTVEGQAQRAQVCSGLGTESACGKRRGLGAWACTHLARQGQTMFSHSAPAEQLRPMHSSSERHNLQTNGQVCRKVSECNKRSLGLY